MDTNKFNALISLLDDTDPVVAEQVDAELVNLGADGLTMLEEVWGQTTDAVVQARLEELINKIQFGHLSEELLAWRKDGGRDFLEGWLLVTQVAYPTLNVQKYKNEIKRMVSRIWLQLNRQMNDLEKLCVINKFIYNMEGYTGNYANPEKPENDLLSTLLDKKKGSSLSLSALYFAISGLLDIPLQVVNFQGYFALRYYRDNSHCYIDSYNKGMFFTPHQVQQFLQKLNAEENVLYYKPLSNIYIVLQLIEALRHNYAEAGNYARAERFERLQKEIEIRFE